MISLDWQTWVALLIVATAVIFIIRRVFIRNGSACNRGCSGCADRGTNNLRKLVSLKATEKHK
jgi:hypothetical protein